METKVEFGTKRYDLWTKSAVFRQGEILALMVEKALKL